MNKKIRLIAAISAVALTFTGCKSKAPADRTQDNRTASNIVTNNPEAEELSHSVTTAGQSVSVSDLKEKYNHESSNIMPLYNVAADEAFDFAFQSDLSDLSLYEAITVHTDEHCTDESEIYIHESIDATADGSKVTVSPLEEVLATDSEETDSIENDHVVWGNASIYYICIHYDPEAKTLTKLDQPIIIPFTVKHEIPAPNVKGVVDNTGRFKLTWEPVEGATEYIVYNLLGNGTWTGSDNKSIPGADKAYRGASLISIAKTNECEFDDFAGKGEHGLAVLERHLDGTPYTLGQNYSVNGEFAVSAVVNGKEGGLSATIPTTDLKLPYQVTDEDDIMFKEFTDESQLPLTLDVTNIDGSVTKRKVLYTYHTHPTYLGTEAPEYQFQIEGTAINGCVGLYSDDPNKVWAESVGEISSVGNTAPDNDIPAVPDNDVETIIPVTPENTQDAPTEEPTTVPENGDETPTEEPTTVPENESDTPTEQPSDAPEANSTSTLFDQQKVNTDLHVENGNHASVAMNDADIMLFADSAEEEWMARNMAAGETSFSIEAFPELQVSSKLIDTFDKVYYQNPYILGVLGINYDYKTFTVHINYCYDQATIAKKQQELSAAAKNICDSIITADMSDDTKRETIYKYLEDNCSYDNAALEDAEKNNFQKTSDNSYEDSFNAYGIIVNKVGVCQS